MMLINRAIVLAGSFVLACCSSVVSAEETVKESVSLPGASLEQEVTYSTSKADYDSTRDGILKRLQDGDQSAMVNPTEGPWKQVETTAMIGFEVKGVGASQGTVHKRQISAAEEALFLFENH